MMPSHSQSARGPRRMVIGVKDIQNITGKGYEASRKMLYRMRKSLNKKKDDLFTDEDFAICTAIREARIKEYLD